MRTPLNAAVNFLRDHRVITDEALREVAVRSDGIYITLAFATEAELANFGSTNFPGATVVRAVGLPEAVSSCWTARFTLKKRLFVLHLIHDPSLGQPAETAFSATAVGRL